MPNVDNDEAVATEAEALADICDWSRGRPLWLQDALRRLVESEELTDEDIDQLTALCKDSAQPAVPLTVDDIRAPDAGMRPVQLASIRDTLNVNALAEGQNLNFLPDGVTIIYGDNGSGKSGYVRVLKRACRARSSDDAILRNIYAVSAGPPQANIEFVAGGQKQHARWTDGEASTPLLSAVSVFDTRTANVHVDGNNDVAYTPYPMKILERLVQACRSVRIKLEAEVNAVQLQTPHSLRRPDCDSETVTGQLITGLSDTTTAKQVDDLATLSTDELERLATLTADFAQDPQAIAGRLKTQQHRLDKQIANLSALSETASNKSATRLQTLLQDYQTRKEAACLAAKNLFTDEPLAEVGSEIWRTLWESARAYSTENAYPEQPFPFVDEDARCVLCQQELVPEAVDRLRRFEWFVQDRTQQHEIQAKETFLNYHDSLTGSVPAISELCEAEVFVRDELGQAALADLIRTFAIKAKWRSRQILRHNSVPATPEPAFPEPQLTVASAELGRRAAAMLAADENEERRALERELQELRDRRWLAGIKPDILAEIQRKKEMKKLRDALKDTTHTQITNKSSALSETLVTNRLRGRFAQEADRLKVAGLAIELRKTRTRHGVPLFRVGLTHEFDAKVGDILSEGEHRCVALAAFLAELSTTDNHSGIVFDDPVSSLDHLHRGEVADRLAEEGQDRQVIVFTHDLPFLFLLEQACRKKRTKVALRHVLRRAGEPGHCDNTPPLKAQTAERRAESLQNHLENVRIQYERDPEGAWLLTAKGALAEIRETWESAIEAALTPVLSRFSNKVDTRGFAKLSAITLQDAEDMRAGFGRCSELLHDASNALNHAVPTPDQVANEIVALRSWIDNLRTRQNRVPDV